MNKSEAQAIREEAVEVEKMVGAATRSIPCQCGTEIIFDSLSDEELTGAIKAAAINLALTAQSPAGLYFFGMLQHLFYNKYARVKSDEILGSETIN